jgi:uncharacterized protein (DUF58 family)
VLASPATRRPTTIDELLPPQLAAALDSVDVVSRRVFPGKLQGERRSKARGRSVEFEDFRPYVPGDDLRHIDWNVFARLDRFFIKIFQEEQDLAVHVVLDASASMDAGNPNKLLFAQRVAMALGYAALAGNNRVAAWIFGGAGAGATASAGLRAMEPVRGRRAAQRLGRFLIDHTFAARSGTTGLAAPGDLAAGEFTAAMRAIARSRTGRGVVVLLSDLLIPGGYEEGLALLGGSAASATGGQWDVLLLQVLAPGELDPLTETDGQGGRIMLGDLRLTDVETGRVAEVTLTPDLVERYKARLAEYQRRLAQFAASRGMTHLVVRSDADVANLVIDELRRRGVLA